MNPRPAISSTLTRPRAEVERDLDQAVADAKRVLELAREVATSEHLERARVERRSFREFARDVLRQSFSSDQELARFQSGGLAKTGMSVSFDRRPPSVSEERNGLCRDLEREERYLQDLRKRLHMFPDAAVETRGERPPQRSKVEVNIHGAGGVQVGDHNQQSVVVEALQKLMQEVERGKGSPEEKKNAKERLRAFLEHPPGGGRGRSCSRSVAVTGASQELARGSVG